MLHRIHQKLGTAGFAIAIVALIAALAGTALAAGALDGKQKKEVTKIAKKFAGKPGAPGAAGAQGPAGPTGPAGPQGKEGAPGKAGTDGADGETVTVTSLNPGAECPEGGAKFSNGTGTATATACNGVEGEEGKEGAEGPEGSPWTAGGVLPSGKTETGMWGFTAHDEGAEQVTLSFPIPLAQAPEHWYLVTPAEEKEEEPKTHEAECPGSFEDPQAAPGDVCFYSAFLTTTTPPNFVNITKSGWAGLFFIPEDSPGSFGFFARGSWAVTAE